MADLKANTEMAWATTVHKAQGCEYKVIIMVASELHAYPKTFFTKELLYTGITRARDVLFVVGTKKALEMVASRPAASSKRISLLSDRLYFAATKAELPLYPLRRFGDGLIRTDA